MAKAKEGSKKPSACKQCNKRLGIKKWYYRNGGFFCTKQCWKKFDLKQKKDKQEAAESKSQEKQE